MFDYLINNRFFVKDEIGYEDRYLSIYDLKKQNKIMIYVENRQEGLQRYIEYTSMVDIEKEFKYNRTEVKRIKRKVKITFAGYEILIQKNYFSVFDTLNTAMNEINKAYGCLYLNFRMEILDKK